MAIVVEEERNKLSIVVVVGWVAVLAAIVVGVYYVFFRKPETGAVIPPPDFEKTKQISEIRLDFSSIVNHPKFQSRKQYISPIVPQSVGRANPFLRF